MFTPFNLFSTPSDLSAPQHPLLLWNILSNGLATVAQASAKPNFIIAKRHNAPLAASSGSFHLGMCCIPLSLCLLTLEAAGSDRMEHRV